MKRWLVASGLVVFAVGVFTTTPAQASGHNVSIKNFAFVPGDQPAAVGDTVTWTNNETDTTAHHVVADDGSFDSGVLTPTHSYTSPTLTKSVSYHCSIHPSMTGTITISLAATTTTTVKPTTTTAKATTTSSSIKPTTTSSSSTSTSTTEPDTTTSEDSTTTTSTTDLVASGASHKGGGAGAVAALIVLIFVVAGAGGYAAYRLRADQRAQAEP